MTDDYFSSVNYTIFSFYNFTTEIGSTVPNSPNIIKKDPAITPTVFQCGSLSLLGGPLIFGPGANISLIKVTLPLVPSSLPSHWKFSLIFMLYEFAPDPRQQVSGVLVSMNQTFMIPGATSLTPLILTCENTDIKHFRVTKMGTMTSNIINILSRNLTIPSPVSYGYFGLREMSFELDLCNETCLVCISDASSCSVCVPNAIKPTTTARYCICPVGFYWLYCTLPCNYQCLQCPTHCLACNSATQCTSCVTNYFLTLDSQCVSSCPINTYVYGLTCLNCDASCRSCSGGMVWDCVTCPSSHVIYKGQCLSTCPNRSFNYSIVINSYSQTVCVDCDSSCLTCTGPYNTQCIQCFDPTSYLGDAGCSSDCPVGQYKYTEKMLCLQCFTGCLACFGPDENQCITCTNSTKNFMINDNICVSECPANKFPHTYTSPAAIVCEYCGLYCAICSGIKTCQECLKGYFLNKSMGYCNISQILIVSAVEEKNPTEFYLFFSNYWSFIKENYHSIISISLINNNVNNKHIGLTYDIMPSVIYENSYFIAIHYNDTLLTNFSLKITIGIDYSLTDYQFILKYNSTQISIPLTSQLYNGSTTSSKIQIISKLSYTKDDAITFKLTFNSIPNIKLLIGKYSSLTISGFSTAEFNYSIIYDSLNTYMIHLTPHKEIVLKPTMQYSLILPEEIVVLNDIANNVSSCSLALYDYYFLSDEETNSIESAENQKEGAEYASGGSAFLGTLLSSGSPLFIQGMMLSQIIYLMKHTKIDFPPNLELLFKEHELPKLFFFYHFEMVPEDEEELPLEFTKEEMSPYFLENGGEMLSKNIAFLILAFILIYSTEKFKIRNNIFVKVLKLFRGIIVWELIIFFYLEFLLKLSFLVTVSLMYPAIHSFQGRLNYAISAVVMVEGALLFVHIFLVIRSCQTLKKSESLEKHKLSIFEKDSPKHRAKISNDRKTRIFDDTFFNTKDMKSSVLALDNNYKKKDMPTSKDVTDFPLTPSSPFDMTPSSPMPIFLSKNNINLPPAQNKSMKVSFIKLSPSNDGSPEENKGINNTEKDNVKSSKSIGLSPLKFRKTVDYLNENESKSPTLILSKRIITNDEIKEHSIKKRKRCIDYQPFKFLYTPDPKYPEQYLKDHLILHEEIKTTNYLCYFVVYDYMRQVTICILIALMRSKPLPQLILINILNLIFLIGTAIFRPFVKTHSLIFGLMNEIITEVALIGILGLAVMDSMENGNTETRMNLGWVVIYANLGLLYWIIFSVIVTLAIKLWEKFRFRKKVFVD